VTTKRGLVASLACQCPAIETPEKEEARPRGRDRSHRGPASILPKFLGLRGPEAKALGRQPQSPPIDIEQSRCRPAVERDADEPSKRQRQHEEHRPNERRRLPFWPERAQRIFMAVLNSREAEPG